MNTNAKIACMISKKHYVYLQAFENIVENIFYFKENCIAKSLRIFSSCMTIGPEFWLMQLWPCVVCLFRSWRWRGRSSTRLRTSHHPPHPPSPRQTRPLQPMPPPRRQTANPKTRTKNNRNQTRNQKVRLGCADHYHPLGPLALNILTYP